MKKKESQNVWPVVGAVVVGILILSGVSYLNNSTTPTGQAVGERCYSVLHDCDRNTGELCVAEEQQCNGRAGQIECNVPASSVATCQPVAYCQDEDGGRVPAVAGMATGMNYTNTANPAVLSRQHDNCGIQERSDAVTGWRALQEEGLWESYCQGQMVKVEFIACDCVNDVCE